MHPPHNLAKIRHIKKDLLPNELIIVNYANQGHAEQTSPTHANELLIVIHLQGQILRRMTLSSSLLFLVRDDGLAKGGVSGQYNLY